MEQHGRLLNEEMKRVHKHMQSAMEQMRDEMQRVGAELQWAMEEFHRQRQNPPEPSGAAGKAARADETSRRPKPRSGKKAPSARKPPSGKKRPRRKPPGGEPAPVKPKPKPMPLKDGAEAPLD